MNFKIFRQEDAKVQGLNSQRMQVTQENVADDQGVCHNTTLSQQDTDTARHWLNVLRTQALAQKARFVILWFINPPVH